MQKNPVTTLHITPYFSQYNGHNDQFISHLLSYTVFKKNTHFDKCHLLSFMLISSWHTEHINKEMFGMDIQLQACLSNSFLNSSVI